MNEGEGSIGKLLLGCLLTLVLLGEVVVGVYVARLMFALLVPEHSATVTVDIPHTESQLVLDEYKDIRSGYFYVYLRTPGEKDRFLTRGDFNEPFCPIACGSYEVLFDGNTATLRYAFSGSSVREDWTELSLNLAPEGAEPTRSTTKEGGKPSCALSPVQPVAAN